MYGSLTERTENGGVVWVLHNVHKTYVSAYGCMEVLQNEQKTEVLYGSHTKLTEVDGGYMTIVPVHASVSDTNAVNGLLPFSDPETCD